MHAAVIGSDAFARGDYFAGEQPGFVSGTEEPSA
jgi:hypothetical protein